MRENDSWTAKWVRKKLLESNVGGKGNLKEVIFCNNNSLDIHHVCGSVFKIATMKSKLVTVDDLSSLGNIEDVDFVINFYQEPYVNEEATMFAKSNNFSIGTFGDFNSALKDDNLREYIPTNLKFFFRAFVQHGAVEKVERIDSYRMRIKRKNLSDVIVLICGEYELSADVFRCYYEKTQNFTVVLAGDPNRGPTDSCVEAIKSTGNEVMNLRHFLGALNGRWN